ncbi:MAG: hypothetical protein PF501_15810 [Salinisphaera sp.]|nr:hypothetical protein [Salinisphaera sp.]
MACILFEDTESTLECLAGPVTSEESPHASPHGSHNDSATHDSVMQRTYYRARGSYRTAALFLGRSDGAVSAALKRRGLPNFTQATARSTVRALASFGDGASLSEACITHGANVHEVEKFLRFGGSAIFECARRIRQDHESDADGSAVTAARRA